MEFNEIGKITQTHGLKGEVKVKAETSFIDERFKVGAKIYYKQSSEYKYLIIKTHRSMQGYELISFEGLDNIDLMMPYLNKTIYAEKDRNLLGENEHFYSDFIGLNVSQFGKIVGKVKEIQEYPHCDYLIVTNDEKEEKMVPLLKDFIIDVDLDNGVLFVIDMEGLLYD